MHNMRAFRHKKRAPSQTPSHLTNENMQKFDNELNKSVIRKGGGGSIYSDARSQFSNYKKHLKELSSCSRSQNLNAPIRKKININNELPEKEQEVVKSTAEIKEKNESKPQLEEKDDQF